MLPDPSIEKESQEETEAIKSLMKTFTSFSKMPPLPKDEGELQKALEAKISRETDLNIRKYSNLFKHRVNLENLEELNR